MQMMDWQHLSLAEMELHAALMVFILTAIIQISPILLNQELYS
jgi:hypothetical protein